MKERERAREGCYGLLQSLQASHVIRGDRNWEEPAASPTPGHQVGVWRGLTGRAALSLPSSVLPALSTAGCPDPNPELRPLWEGSQRKHPLIIPQDG